MKRRNGIIWGVLALAVVIVWVFVWPDDRVDAETGGVGYFLLRWGHALVWIFLSASFFHEWVGGRTLAHHLPQHPDPLFCALDRQHAVAKEQRIGPVGAVRGVHVRRVELHPARAATRSAGWPPSWCSAAARATRFVCRRSGSKPTSRSVSTAPSARRPARWGLRSSAWQNTKIWTTPAVFCAANA